MQRTIQIGRPDGAESTLTAERTGTRNGGAASKRRVLGAGAAQLSGIAMLIAAVTGSTHLHGQAATPAPAQPPAEVYTSIPGFDTASIDTGVDPCTDFYKFACGHFAANHPIPADQGGVDQFYALENVNTQSLRGILEKTETGGGTRGSDEQKIGDFYHACMDREAIDRNGLAPVEPLFRQIDGLGNSLLAKRELAPLVGSLQRVGVDVFFGFGEQQDFKDASKQIAQVGQGGLGLPEKDYYLRTGAKDEEIRRQYVAHVAKMLTLAGSTPEQADKDAAAILKFETALAKGSLGVTEMRDPEKIYHLQPISTFEGTLPGVDLSAFERAVHAPQVTEINNATPQFFPALVLAVRDTDMRVLKAYMRVHVLHTFAVNLPQHFYDEDFDFYRRKLRGVPAEPARWKTCSREVDTSLGEALGKVYVAQYFAGDSKAKMLSMVHDIEHAMDQDIDSLSWMSAPTKVRAKEKLTEVANKIGYPDKWRDYSALTVKPDDAAGNEERANAFENDREFAKIGKPVDRGEWDMSPPTVNAYYNGSMNDINFPAGILQPAFYDPKQDVAVNYGHIGAVIGHELTHGFDDEGRKFDGKGNLSDWWTPDDAKQFETRTGCLVNEYGGFTAVDDLKVNGQLTLGENTADNGGLVLAYMAYLDRAKKDGINPEAKIDGYTGPQQFYIAFAQNWCENSRPETVRSQVLQDPHAPNHFRANGAIVNQPGFAAAFGCKRGSAMAPTNSCRVW